MSWIDDFESSMLDSPATAGPPLRESASPLELATRLDGKYRERAHLRYLSERLTKAMADVETGQDRFVMVQMPPRMGKSVMSSVQFPTWSLAKHNDWKHMLLSHSPALASGWGRSVRRLVEQNDLDIKIAHDAGAVTDWETTEAGVMVSRSIGQSVTGLGAKVMILDDIVKDFATAHSSAHREAVWDWWTFNARTRLHPPSLVIAIGTRWHEDDFLGRLIKNATEDWEVIRFPAIATADDVLGRHIGEPLLSPLIEETTEQALERWAAVKASVGTYAWAALYQQDPQPADGSIFNSDWFQYWHPGEITAEMCDRVLTSWDCAFKDTSGSDYVVGQRWGLLGANRYLLDQVRGRWSFTETLRQMERFCEGTHEHLVEDKANGTAVIDVLKVKIPGMIPINPTASKEARARSVTPEIESGNVFLPYAATFTADLVAELAAFPSGSFDDQCDAMSQALTRMRGPRAVTVLQPGTQRIQRGPTPRPALRGVRTARR